MDNESGMVFGVFMSLFVGTLVCAFIFGAMGFDVVDVRTPNTYEKPCNGIMYKITVEQIATYNIKGSEND